MGTNNIAITTMIGLIIAGAFTIYCILKDKTSFFAFKYRFVPYATRDLIENADEPVIILDTVHNRIAYNSSMIKSFPQFADVEQMNRVEGIVRFFAENALPSREKECVLRAVLTGREVFKGELEFGQTSKKFFKVHIKPIYTKKNIAGISITLDDITSQKNMIQELNEKNAELTAMVDQLNEYSYMVEALAVERERNRMAHDLHDTVGQSMTMIHTLLKVCMISCKKDQDVKGKLAEALDVTKKGISELKRTVNGLAPRELDSKDLIHSLKELLRDFERSGLHVALSVDCPKSLFREEHSLFIYRLCQEALTNSVRHGRAKNAAIDIEAYRQNLRIRISDDGHCAKIIVKGMGLKGMEERAHELNGSLNYSFGDGLGFRILAEIPYTDNEADSEFNMRQLALATST